VSRGLITQIPHQNQTNYVKITSRENRSASCQKEAPATDNFIPAQTELRSLPDQQVLVRNLFIAEGNFP
jgi:hypothetical protein